MFPFYLIFSPTDCCPIQAPFSSNGSSATRTCFVMNNADKMIAELLKHIFVSMAVYSYFVNSPASKVWGHPS